jgi:hypothetical protein
MAGMDARIQRWFMPWRWNRRWRLSVLLLIVSMAYLTSVGPAIWLHDRQRLPQWASGPIRILYSPLGLLVFTGWDFGVLKRYVEWWESLP